MLKVQLYSFSQGTNEICDECPYPPAWIIQQEITGDGSRRGLACPSHADKVLFAIQHNLPGTYTTPPAE